MESPQTNNDIFYLLDKLNIDYGHDNIHSKYFSLAKDADLKTFLEWDNKIASGEFLQCTISVTTDDKSDFIPFVAGWGISDKISREFQKTGETFMSFNHADLVDELCILLGRKYISRVQFNTSWNVTNETIDISDTGVINVNPSTNAFWYTRATDDIRIDKELNTLLLSRKYKSRKEYVNGKGEGSFAREITKYYHNNYGVNKLCFLIISVDSNYKERSQTRIMFISQSEETILNFFEKRFNRIREIVSAIRFRNVYDLLQKNIYEATKSAKAAIMSRNMSHNIGSHVMSYLKQKLGSVTSILSEENQVLYNLTDDENIKKLLIQKDTNSNTSNSQTIESTLQKPTTEDAQVENNETDLNRIQLPFLVGTGRFIGYLQERQDYIATIATDYIPYGAPVNLKDAIYDELNPDLRYMRHKADGNKPMNVLLSFIAKSEGLTREHMDNCTIENDRKVDELKFKTHEDILFGFPEYETGKKPHVFGIDPRCCNSEDTALSEMRKINFSLPGGLVGRQAIFSIVENLIRNAAKHGNPRSTERGNLELTFDVIDLADLDNCTCLDDRICDPVWQFLYKSANDREQLYLFSITDNLTYKNDAEGQTLADKLRPALIEDYLDENGNMRPTNKGIKEIRISAAWMRDEVSEDRYLTYDDAPLVRDNDGNPIKDKNGYLQIDKDKEITPKKAPLVGIEITKEGHLRYMICLPQDRLAAVITDDMSPEDKVLFEKLEQLRPKDWKLYKTVKEAKADGKISYHYMLVAPGKYDEFRPYTSNRLFVWNPSDRNRLELEEVKIQLKNAEQQKEDVEKMYVKVKDTIIRQLHHITDKSELIYIWDKKAFAEQKQRMAKGESECKKVICAESDDNATIAQYVYRTHHSTENEFKSYWEERSKSKDSQSGNYSQIACIDAITGDNSSDRIVRREPLNEEWYCSHLRAMKKRVAIFDERLFMIVHNIDENKFINPNTDAENAIVSLINRLRNGENLQSIKNEIKEKRLLKEQTNNIIVRAKTPDALIEKLEGFCETITPQAANNYKSIVYREKGVDVFTIVREKEGSFAIIGCVGDHTGDDGEVVCEYNKIATITSITDPFNVNIQFHYNGFAKQYDYISIHQGILDKIYEGFGIKEHGKVNDPKKCQMTQRLHEEFMKEEGNKPIAVKDDNNNPKENFLPCFIIHSGRAKPTKNDMPQEQPFIQYAAIEHGVQDCKYALVELLDYARYES